MSTQPAFYEEVRRKAERRWDQLEQDPELAGPWHQLFKQVQSPRHVLSELLQNADDAGATEASVYVDDGTFLFEHNGTDFSKEDFASLCRFGYSNKRALHTIGFRGIGFKSTFSLGDCVKLFTPSLAVCFHNSRFSEPRWLSEDTESPGRTRIVVEISDRHRQTEVTKNLDEWLKTPVSLLFFKNVRVLKISDQEMRWGSMGPGPIPGSEWMAPNENADAPHLLIRSTAEAFPEEALEEIKQERMLGIDEGTEFPPCNIEIVLGAEGRLYVVLPTGVMTKLPFACHAPFIQDPARLRIKDPETSPTNRWLLERAGKLAATAMLRWLGQTDMPTLERAPAYGLFPNIGRAEASLEGVCGNAVEKSFGEGIDDQPVLLTEDGSLVSKRQGIAIPQRLMEVWPADQVAATLDDERRPAVSRYVELADRKKLLNWGIVEEIDRQDLLEILQRKRLPKPATWRQLLNLWAYIAPSITGYRRVVDAREIRFVPVQGKDVLYAANETVRLGEKKLLQSEDDWVFLAEHLIVLNQNWPRFLAERRRTVQNCGNASAVDAIEAAYAVLKKVGLDETSDVNKVIDTVSAGFFSRKDVSNRDCVQLTQIAAKIGATVRNSFLYVTIDGEFRSIEIDLLFDRDGSLADLLPENLRDSRVLHPDYTAQFSSCSKDDWHQWIASGRSGLNTFVPIQRKHIWIGRQQRLDDALKKRGFKGDVMSQYSNPSFHVNDWDFDEACWNRWQDLAAEDPQTWLVIADKIMSERDSYWSSKMSAQVIEQASNGYKRSVIRQGLTPTWALKLGSFPCLPDTHDDGRKPGDLLRRTPETEPLIDVESFVHARVDSETNHPLLDLIGVQSTPTGPSVLLDRLRALAQVDFPPVREVEKWYRRLDMMVTTCSTDEFKLIRQAFRAERLILTQNGVWEAAPGVFLNSGEEDVPDAEIIRKSVNYLTLWNKIGVADRPTAELAIEWLKGLPADTVLNQETGRRIRSLLARHPVRIWEKCRHWLNLAGEWVAVEGLTFSLTMQSLIPWSHFHPSVKKRTADLQTLPAEVTGRIFLAAIFVCFD